MKENGCPFCDPKDPVLMCNDYANVILSNPRKTAGHVLVVPKRHIEKPWELTKDELSAIFELIFSVENKMIGTLGDGCDIRQNYRPFQKPSNIKVNHIHFHVITRSFEDYIYQVSEKNDTDLFTELGDDEAKQVAEIIKG